MYKYKVNLYPVETTNGEEWIARIPEVNNCGGSGSTPEEALKDVYKNLEVELEILREQNKPLPKTKTDLDCSGKLLLRLPKSLHSKVAQIAEEEGISINQFIMFCISENVGQLEGAQKTFSFAYFKGFENSINHTLRHAKEQTDVAIKNLQVFEVLEQIQEIQNRNAEMQNEGAVALLNKARGISKENYTKGYWGN